MTTFHKNHLGVTKEDAMTEYLKLSQDLEMFGIAYYPVVNKRGTEVVMGLDSRGINVYNVDDRLNPTISFPWSEIKQLKPSKKDIKIQLVTKDKDKAPPFVVKTPDAFVIFDVAVGNQDLFVRRRKPQDSLEMQQMKVCVCLCLLDSKLAMVFKTSYLFTEGKGRKAVE